MKKERNYGIDLLRLVLMFMVCILHTLGQGGVLSATETGTISHYVFIFLNAFAFCAVDGFALISGYVANNETKKYEKLVNMWFQIIFYSLILTIILTLVGVNKSIEIKDIIKNAFPITFNKFWYATSYFALFLSMPILNKFIFGLNKKDSKKMLIILIIMFSFVGIIKDPFITKWGYSAIWLMVLYCIGALANQIELFKNIKTSILILTLIVSTFFAALVKILFDIDRLINYVSPLILLNGIIMIVLFSRIKIKWKNITKFSSLAFGIYLFQLNQVIYHNVIKDAFTFIVTKNIFISVLYVILISLIIFICGMAIEWLRQKFAKLIKINELSKKIVNIFNKIIEKLFILLGC